MQEPQGNTHHVGVECTSPKEKTFQLDDSISGYERGLSPALHVTIDFWTADGSTSLVRVISVSMMAAHSHHCNITLSILQAH